MPYLTPEKFDETARAAGLTRPRAVELWPLARQFAQMVAADPNQTVADSAQSQASIAQALGIELSVFYEVERLVIARGLVVKV
jgi:hypothetical protein